MTGFDTDAERQVDTFVLGELTEPQKSQDRTEQFQIQSLRECFDWNDTKGKSATEG